MFTQLLYTQDNSDSLHSALRLTPTFLYAYKNEANSWSRLRQMSTVFFPFRDVAYLDIYSGKHFPKATLLFGP
uniref:Uncharacterized protein n=2 Tax=Ursus TaxID=9639 RepID=A0A452U4I9_URSMA